MCSFLLYGKFVAWPTGFCFQKPQPTEEKGLDEKGISPKINIFLGILKRRIQSMPGLLEAMEIYSLHEGVP